MQSSVQLRLLGFDLNFCILRIAKFLASLAGGECTDIHKWQHGIFKVTQWQHIKNVIMTTCASHLVDVYATFPARQKSLSPSGLPLVWATKLADLGSQASTEQLLSGVVVASFMSFMNPRKHLQAISQYNCCTEQQVVNSYLTCWKHFLWNPLPPLLFL